MSNAQSAPASDKTSAFRETMAIVRTVIYALVVALILRIVFFQPYAIPSASMEPNVYEGDYIVVSKFPYGWSRHAIPFSPPLFSGRIMERRPERGDIVVFKLPSDGHIDYVKRLVGLPGDRLQMKDSQLFVNGQPVERLLLSPVKSEMPGGLVRDVPRHEERLPGGRAFVTQDIEPASEYDNTGVYIVPEGQYFMMGDNRDNSRDSRVDPAAGGVGFVPAENLVGRAEIILLSWKPQASIFKPWTWIVDARPSRFFKVLK